MGMTYQKHFLIGIIIFFRIRMIVLKVRLIKASFFKNYQSHTCSILPKHRWPLCIYIYTYNVFILPKSIYTSFQFFLHFLIIEPTILHIFQKRNCNFLGISPTQTLGHCFSLCLETVPADFPSLNPPRLDFVGRFFSASEELNATLVKCQAIDFSVGSIECESMEYVCEKKKSFGDGGREFGGKRGWNWEDHDYTLCFALHPKNHKWFPTKIGTLFFFWRCFDTLGSHLRVVHWMFPFFFDH